MNFKNRTLFAGRDNIEVLRRLDTDSVDLIYLDPPFNSKRDYAAPIGSKAAGAAFKDTWTLKDSDLAWHGEIAEREPALYQTILGAGTVSGKPTMAYLIMMGVRMIEMRRILKRAGSIYLHCDDAAVHHLKTMMDAVFGKGAYRNTLTWKRASGHSNAKHQWGRITDHILFYAHKGATMNPVYAEHNPDYIKKMYSHKDSEGNLFRLDPLTGHGTTQGESGQEWGGYDPSDPGHHWLAPRTGEYAKWIEENKIPGYRSIEGVHARLDALKEAGLVKWSNKGTPSLVRYLAATKGRRVCDNWADIPPLMRVHAEYLKYPAQKPLALLERIVAASSNPGDVVLDPFCGSATALEAAERLGRQWAGIDISPEAVRMVDIRLKGKNYGGIKIYTPDRLPRRSDAEGLPPPRTHAHDLYGKQEGGCNGCGGRFPFKLMEVDHIVPKAKGGDDDLDNLQLLCSHCNRRKGSRSWEEFKAEMDAR